MKTKIKTVHGEDIWLEETTNFGVIIPAAAITLAVLSAGFFLFALETLSELYLMFAGGCIIAMLFFVTLMVIGVFSTPAYFVYSYNRTSSNQTVTILNDGTDQARVCIAAKTIENQIIEDYNRIKNLEKIAEGCK